MCNRKNPDGLLTSAFTGICEPPLLSFDLETLMLALCLQPTNDQLDWALVLVQEYANGGSLLDELQSGWMRHADSGSVDVGMVLQVRRSATCDQLLFQHRALPSGQSLSHTCQYWSPLHFLCCAVHFSTYICCCLGSHCHAVCR
jgi:hypothetical protein